MPRATPPSLPGFVAHGLLGEPSQKGFPAVVNAGRPLPSEHFTGETHPAQKTEEAEDYRLGPRCGYWLTDAGCGGVRVG